jgi:hypothetical protein
MPRMSRRGRVTAAVFIGVFVLFSVLGSAVDLWTEVLWFDEVGYTRVFTGVIWTRVGLFMAVGLGMALVIAANLALAYRLRPLLRPHSPEQASLERYRILLTPRIGVWIVLVSVLVGFFAGLSAQGRWREWLLFRNGGDFGVGDPQFNVDVGFYIFDYPFWRFLLGLGFATIVLSLIGALGMHYLYGGVRLQGVGDRITTAARAHLTTLVAFFVGLKAVAYWLDRRALVLEFNEGTGLFGAGNAGIEALLPAKEMLMYIAIIVAVAIIVFSNAVIRNLTWPGVALALLGLAAVAIGGIYPWAVQTFSVNPTLREKEAEYISRTIESTRQAFDLDDTVMTPYGGRNVTPPQSIADDETLADSIRLLDPELLSETYTQLQQVRGFYGFGDKLDVVRYEQDGELADYVVGLREISYADLTAQQNQWQNRHAFYTHGYGLVAAPANRIGCTGRPFFASGFLGAPSQDEGSLGEQCTAGSDQLLTTQPRVYYGEEMTEYAIVGGREEFDRPAGEEGEQTYTYTGEGGVDVGSFGRKLLYAIRFREANFILSEVVNPESKVMYERDPRTRVEKVAPFLTLDGDPYPAIVDGRITWIVDGYTTAATYPYSQRINLQEQTTDALTGVGTFALAREDVNYMRNSVKATVDAYDGTVTLYEFDEEDPVLAAWNAAFGGDLIVPKEETPPALTEHFRYPVDMFKVQRNLLTRFYVQDSDEFFSGQDFWQVPANPAEGSLGLQPPYYLLTQFPGQDDPTFQLVSAVSPVERLNLAALISGAYVDGELVLEAWALPSDTRIAGPIQVHQEMTNNAAVAQQLTLLQQQGTRQVEFGNLLSLPYADGMLYAEPVYVRSTQQQDAFPLMQRVLMSYGEYVTLAGSLEEGLEQLAEAAAEGVPTLPPPDGEPPPPTDPGVTPTPTPPAEEPPPPPAEPPADVAEAVARVQAAIEEARDAQAAGDFARYGQALEDLDEALADLEAALAAAEENP